MKLGVIGGGNMAGAIVNGLLASGMPAQDIMISDIDTKKLVDFAAKGVQTGNNTEAAVFGDTILFAIKPNIFPVVLPEINSIICDKLIVSIAAGISIEYLENNLGQNARLARIMPNTPALVGAGMSAISFGRLLSEEDMETVKSIFAVLGRITVVKEELMDAVVSVSGSSPAFVFMLIDAMADGAVKEGLPRDKSIMMAAQTVMGAAKMVLDTGKHPAQLKDMVCSPGGTTIDAVAVLEKQGFKSSVIEAMASCSEKSRRLSGK